MSAILLVLAMAAAPARGEAFVRNLGPAIQGKPDCYAVGDRYAACAAFDASGELLRVDVEPRVQVMDRNAQFDREQSLSRAEYLDVITKLTCAVDLGEYQPDDTPHVYATMNGLYTPIEQWSNAAVRKWVVYGEDRVMAIDVIFYRKVAGRVRMKPCKPVVIDAPEAFEIPCPELALGPSDVTIDDVDYVVAPRDQRIFTPDEAIDVYVADFRNHAELESPP
ncbi:MAG: hypothetical protein JWO97_1869 [Acidobacteria bacterium]|nr:hypothetical protein [Acidobacteriota bacterium]